MDYVLTGAVCLAIGLAGGLYLAHAIPTLRAWLAAKIAPKA